MSRIQCPDCRGTGGDLAVLPSGWHHTMDCLTCGGTGEVNCNEILPVPEFRRVEP